MGQFALLGAAVLLLNSLVAGRNVIVESLFSAPDGWERVDDPDPSTVIKLRIALEQPNVSSGKFEQTLYEISSPEHHSYGQHLSREELRALVKPRQESTDTVVAWLKAADILDSDIEDAGEWVNFRTTIAKAGDLLNADFGIYNFAGTEDSRIRTLKYSVPEHIESHITMVQPTTVFGRMQRHVSQIFKVEEAEESEALLSASAAANQTDPLQVCNYFITPNCLRVLYKVGNYTANPSAKTILGVSGFLNEFAKHDSLQTFLAKFAPHATSQTFITPLVNGGEDNQTDTDDDDVEANLDIQYVAALGYDADLRFYSVGGRGPLIPDLETVPPSQPYESQNSNEPYLEFVSYLLNLTDDQLPTTLSTSYGDNEREIPIAYAQKVCEMLGQLGARGVTVIFSSGDTGPGSACQTNDGTKTPRFTPTFPGACPYITTVGGTAGVAPEKAISFSSGGFSDYFPRPAYQDAAVTGYLAGIGDVFSGLYNVSGRGFPDVSAQGNAFRVVEKGSIQSVSGTSASAPTFAGIISLVNNALVAHGRSPLGFLNPWLYSVVSQAGGLTDITQGGSRGCGPTSQYSGLPTPEIIGAGWNATVGWDPVTGLGTPLFTKLLALAFLNTTQAEGSYGDDAYKHARVGSGRRAGLGQGDDDVNWVQ
ncbi:putative Tripeptidyl-peptidase 1 [Seiridium cardinale]|uniref:tripeptidyl-peptidase II n=1 Tax=Seiridium cardinale TaxID=138064 RepID=A0ABR2XKY2_9PEZI